MQDCVTEDTECQGELREVTASLRAAQAALAACLNFIGEDPSVMGVLGAAAAALVATEAARIWWRRWHPEGPDFPPDR
jgi:hypothetical protein